MDKEAYTLFIHTKENKCFLPAVFDGISWETQRKGQPGKLTFSCIQDEALKIDEGAIVQFKKGKNKIFQGVIFSRKLDKDNKVSIIAYDQLRYLKNKKVYSAVNKTATAIIKELADDFQLKFGDLVDTKYVIPKFRAGDQTLFDLMQTALDITTESTKELYVLYDDYGKLTIKNIKDLLVNILIDGETAENYNYESSIDKDTYNQIKLFYDNKDTGKRDVWLAKDSKHIKTWGLLEKAISINPKKSENPQEKAMTMLKKYNKATRTLNIKNAFGDIRVRAGSSLWFNLKIDGQDIKQRLLVESVKHTFDKDVHTMDLKLRGGMFDS